MPAPIHLDASTLGPAGCREPDVAPRSSHAERRTRVVVALTALMMIAELVVGFWTNSMALTADGFHMATHAGALGIAALAYWYARTRHHAEEFSFGTGKVYALAGFTNAIVLGLVALLMLGESVHRLFSPEPIDFRESIPVAVLGLLVNLASALLLRHDHDHVHEPHDHAHEHGHHDHNLRAAYMHVLADALTSVLAIAALVGGLLLGWRFLDPAVGALGGIVILQWSVGLARDSGKQLLDVVPSARMEESIRRALQTEPALRVLDLHVWELGPGRCGCVVALASPEPREASHYRKLILDTVDVSHLTVEVHRDRAVTAV
jgi:cation diffusion facilitator family transporter